MKTLFRLISLLVLPVAIALFVSRPAPAMQKARAWWAFESPTKRPPSSIQNPKLVLSGANGSKIQNPIDSFLLSRLREKDLDFAPPADRRTLIRRLSFDLTGLPPSPELLSLTYEQAVERLLASTHYGERWARHWLDVVRFGETDGGEHNYERWNAWPYRDYVIKAFNSDLPYNQFVRDQIAGDVLFPGDREKLAATGFLVAGPWDQVSAVLNKDPIQRKQARMDELDDMVTSTSATFLGLTVGCARCHDHKFDPIPTRDYYRMTAAFSGGGFGERSVGTKEDQARYDAEVKTLRSELSQVESALSEMEQPVTARLLAAKFRALEELRRGERRRIPLNPIYNREAFPPVSARWVRLTVSAHVGGTARMERLELRPAGHVTQAWRSERAATADKPVSMTVDLGEPKQVSEAVWTVNESTGARDGQMTIYRLESSNDGTTWNALAANTDHVSSLELDLPVVSEDEMRAALSDKLSAKRAELRTRRDELQKRIGQTPSPAKIYCVTSGKPEPAHVLERGNAARPGEEVTPGTLTAISQLSPTLDAARPSDEGQRRLALANWITDRRNPLTARVAVNRVWAWHFGTGLVATPSDFGVNGDRPSHPELLDWLAVSFMEKGWSLKWLHRQIVTSRAYRQSSVFNARAARVDAGNRLLWRMPLRRMDAETLRDSLLWLSGSLDTRMGGPGFPLHEKGPRGSYIYHALDNDGPAVWRRAVYRFVVRGGNRTLLDSFDCPDPSVATPQRQISNTPVQALALLNNAFVIRQADLFARRLEREAPNPSDRIRKAYLLAVGREARESELIRGVDFVAKHSFAAFCRALVNSNEFIYTP